MRRARACRAASMAETVPFDVSIRFASTTRALIRSAFDRTGSAWLSSAMRQR
jgi:hypothetical protein